MAGERVTGRPPGAMFSTPQPGCSGEDGADGGGDHLVLGLGHMRQRVAHEVDAAALPTPLEDLREGGLQAFVRL